MTLSEKFCHSEGATGAFRSRTKSERQSSRNISKVEATFVILREQLEHFAAEQSLKRQFSKKYFQSQSDRRIFVIVILREQVSTSQQNNA
jgi:hypothetical protein